MAELTAGAGTFSSVMHAAAEAMRSAIAQRNPDAALATVVAAVVADGPCDHASVVLLGQGGTARTAAASTSSLAAADDTQFQLGEGPGWDASRTADTQASDDLCADLRWPRWSPVAIGLGIGSVISVPLHAASTLGTLNLYSAGGRRFDRSQLDLAGLLAAHVSVAVAHTQMQEHLTRAAQGRNIIGQAQGMLMERYSLTADQSFALLRRYSQDGNIKLAAIAGQLIATGRLPDLNNGDRRDGRVNRDAPRPAEKAG